MPNSSCRDVLAVVVMVPNVVGEVIVRFGVPSAIWFSTLVNWKLRSAPTRSVKLSTLVTERSRFQRGRLRMAYPPQLESNPRTHLRNSPSTAAGSWNMLMLAGVLVPTLVFTPLITAVLPALL